MTPTQALMCMVGPALSLLPDRMDTKQAEALLLAIALQESRLLYRRQINGTAKSYFQFERVGINGVLTHPATKVLAFELCRMLDYYPDPDVVYGAVEHNDLLACGMARLNLWADPQPLPGLKDSAGAYALYLRCWRPGRPKPDSWPDLYQQALNTI